MYHTNGMLASYLRLFLGPLNDIKLLRNVGLGLSHDGVSTAGVQYTKLKHAYMYKIFSYTTQPISVCIELTSLHTSIQWDTPPYYRHLLAQISGSNREVAALQRCAKCMEL